MIDIEDIKVFYFDLTLPGLGLFRIYLSTEDEGLLGPLAISPDVRNLIYN